jgi:NAD+ synthase
LVELLGIKHFEINIKEPVDALRKELGEKLSLDPNDYDVYRTNTPARIRMATLYGISAIYGGRVANTCNLSEDYVGYSTKFGDAAGDFSPLSDFTKTEVRELGRELGLPARFVEKIPEDGMSGKSDEEKLGFTYEMLDKYIRTGVIEDEAIKAKIDRMHKLNLHKLQLMPSYKQGK